jgi:hypothetical protein
MAQAKAQDPISKIIESKNSWGLPQVVKDLPSRWEVQILSSNSSTSQKKRSNSPEL